MFLNTLFGIESSGNASTESDSISTTTTNRNNVDQSLKRRSTSVMLGFSKEYTDNEKRVMQVTSTMAM